METAEWFVDEGLWEACDPSTGRLIAMTIAPNERSPDPGMRYPSGRVGAMHEVQSGVAAFRRGR